MPKQTIPPDLQSQKLVLDSLILEYKNTFERSDKLDNKVYIVITFCGFVFVFITNLFGGLTGLVMPEGTLALLLTVLYVGSCLAVMLAYVLVSGLFPQPSPPERSTGWTGVYAGGAAGGTVRAGDHRQADRAVP